MEAKHTAPPVRTPLTAGPTAAANRRTLGWLSGGLVAAAGGAGALVAPTDRIQGDVQRLMYLHVPAAWTGLLAFGVVLAASVGYLATRDLRWDRCGRAAAEIGIGATLLALLAGAGWGRAVWGTWWAWDPRLVSTALLILVYAGYLAIRGAVGDTGAGHRAARAAAVTGIAAFGLVPVVHFSVVWWRSLHQQATVLGRGRPPLDLVMGISLTLSVLACTGVAAWLFLHRLSRLETAALGGAADQPAHREFAAGADRPAHREFAVGADQPAHREFGAGADRPAHRDQPGRGVPTGGRVPAGRR